VDGWIVKMNEDNNI